jgi:hypothetical protein
MLHCMQVLVQVAEHGLEVQWYQLQEHLPADVW